MDGGFHDRATAAQKFRPEPRAALEAKAFVALPGLTTPKQSAGFRPRSVLEMAIPLLAQPGPQAAETVTPQPRTGMRLPQAAAALAPGAALADIVEMQAVALPERVAGASRPVPQASMPAPGAVLSRQREPDADELARAHAAGLSEGKALGRQEAESEAAASRRALAGTAQALAAALEQLASPPASAADALAKALEQAVAHLASERAGQAIDAAPAPFARRIARLAERVAQGTANLVVRLHPDDHAAILPLLKGATAPDLAILAEARLVPDSGLMRGDAALRAPGVFLSDLLIADPISASIQEAIS